MKWFLYNVLFAVAYCAMMPALFGRSSVLCAYGSSFRTMEPSDPFTSGSGRPRVTHAGATW